MNKEVLDLHQQRDKYDLGAHSSWFHDADLNLTTARSAAISLKRLLQTDRSFMRIGGHELTTRLLIKDKSQSEAICNVPLKCLHTFAGEIALLWKPQNGMKAIRVPPESDAYKATHYFLLFWIHVPTSGGPHEAIDTEE